MAKIKIGDKYFLKNESSTRHSTIDRSGIYEVVRMVGKNIYLLSSDGEDLRLTKDELLKAEKR